MENDFNAYDHGFRLGTFDRCNGRTNRLLNGIDEADLFESGYADGFATNENQFPPEKSPDDRYNEAYDLGAERARCLEAELEWEAKRLYPDDKESYKGWLNGVWDNY